MSVEDLIIRLRIEEDNKAAERRSRGNSAMSGANIVEDDQNNSKKRKKAGNESNQPKKSVEEEIYMANSATAKVEGTGKVCLKMTSDKVLTLNNVLDISDINATKRMLKSKFDMKDLGVATVILGIRIHRTPQGLALSQFHYIEKVLDKFKYMKFGIAKTPLDMSFALQKNEGESDSQLKYARVLGYLMYIINCTRPDIAYVISKLSRYTSNTNKTHWMAMKRVLGYLKYTEDYTLHYNKYPAILEGYSDANWITESNEVKSTSGYIFTIGGGVVSWKSSKQTYISRSTMESEFFSLDKADEEVKWLQNFLEDIPYWPKPVAPSKDNVSDPLTKGLSREGVERTSKETGLRPRTSQHSVESKKGDGQLSACEVTLLHYEDMDIPKDVAKLGVRHGMWGNRITTKISLDEGVDALEQVSAEEDRAVEGQRGGDGRDRLEMGGYRNSEQDKGLLAEAEMLSEEW
ncbi:hypothetical protein FXO37_00155 [Capsicum annuum]|nr:hypothetical protein FXO37_00155 [Capsicum annuum]